MCIRDSHNPGTRSLPGTAHVDVRSGILHRHSQDLFFGVQVEVLSASVSVRQLGRRTVEKTRPLMPMSGRVPAGPRRGCGVAHSVPVPLLWCGPRRPDPASAAPRSAGPKSAELVDLVESLVSRCAVGQLMALDDLAVAESDNDVASGGKGQVV